METINFIWFGAGVLLSAVVFIFWAGRIKKEIKVLKRQYEKKSVGMDDSSLKIKTLESKIKTLETALKKQMGEK